MQCCPPVLFLSLVMALAWPAVASGAGIPDADAAERQGMVDDIRATMARTGTSTPRGNISERVLDAMGRVPRHEFVPAAMRDIAYANRPLPIGHGQTISQPYIVALMTALAAPEPDSVVLEIGTGSGYQAAVLGLLAQRVFSIEIVPELGMSARATLQRLGYANVEVIVGDGYHGLPGQAPFDAIVVTAAPESIPAPLIEQLKPGGRLVVPVGPRDRTQSLKLLRKDAAGEVVEEDVLPVGFVPFTRER